RDCVEVRYNMYHNFDYSEFGGNQPGQLPNLNSDTITIDFDPIPASEVQVVITYVPYNPWLILANYDPHLRRPYADYADYIVADVCSRLAIREESDPSGFELTKQQIEAKIVHDATPRDIGKPARLQLVDPIYEYDDDILTQHRYRFNWT